MSRRHVIPLLIPEPRRYKRHMRRVTSTAAVWVIVCAAALSGCGDSDARNALGEGQTDVLAGERVWVDTSRTTPRTSRFPGEPQRRLRVRLWLPPGRASRPLLLLAHGYGGLPEKFEAFARTVASAGFVIAAPAFPLTNENAPGGHEVGLPDTVSQPGDLSFVITRLLEASATPEDPLAGRIQASAVAVLGHSLGGLTAIALTHLPCCRDGRVGATIWVAPVDFLRGLFWSDPLSADGPPTLIIHGTADSAVPYATAPALYAQLEPPRVLVGLDGAGHSEALESQEEPPINARLAAQRATIAFLDSVFSGDTPALHSTLAALAAAGNVVESDDP
jgi:alpha-beta hydrolase superfamily lysophospholipase